MYDFAAIVCDAQGVEYKSMHCLIAETLQDVSAMRTSYYNNKMPLYLAQLANAQVQITTWNECRKQFITMCDNCNGRQEVSSEQAIIELILQSL